MKTQQSPNPEKSLAAYVLRQRIRLGLSQKEVAAKSGIHAQSIGKIERGQTIRLNHKTKQGLAYALGISEDSLEAASKGIAIEDTGVLKFCPDCWKPGTQPESMWFNTRSQYCFLCGSALRHTCPECNAAITSLKHRFCPYCGTPYNTKA